MFILESTYIGGYKLIASNSFISPDGKDVYFNFSAKPEFENAIVFRLVHKSEPPYDTQPIRLSPLDNAPNTALIELINYDRMEVGEALTSEQQAAMLKRLAGFRRRMERSCKMEILKMERAEARKVTQAKRAYKSAVQKARRAAAKGALSATDEGVLQANIDQARKNVELYEKTIDETVKKQATDIQRRYDEELKEINQMIRDVEKGKMPKIQRTFVTIFVFSTQLGFSFFDAKKLGKSQKPVNQISHSFKNCQLFSAKVKKLHFFYFSKL